MIQHLQSLFSRLAGIATFEADRLAQAHAIFADSDRRFGELDRPAYLRRKARVGAAR